MGGMFAIKPAQGKMSRANKLLIRCAWNPFPAAFSSAGYDERWVSGSCA